MGDKVARAEESREETQRLEFLGSKHEDAAQLYKKASNSFKLGRSWDKAESTYVKFANCHLKHEAAQAYVDAAHCYQKTLTSEAITCLNHALEMFCDIGRISMAARYYKEIAGLFESEVDTERAIAFL